MSDPLVSICMSAYNAEAHVAEALDSALAQTWANQEIVIVNDGSTDETGAITDWYAEEHDEVTAVHQENQGHSAGMNRAYAESSGELIKFFDADDLISPEMVEKQVRRLEGHRTHVASAEWGRFYGDDPLGARFEPEPVWRDMDPVDWLVESWTDGWPMQQCAIWLIPRQILERSGQWNEGLSLINDFEYFTRVLLSSDGIRFASGARVYYRSGHGETLSGRVDREALESELDSICLATDHLLDEEDSPRTRLAAANRLQEFVYDWYPLHPDLREEAEKRIEALGGSDISPDGPPGFQVLRRVVGWKVARRIERFARRNGLNRASLEKVFSTGSA
jgi:glycosyltransferase involved in cell wall biosynthesis